jgi:integrase
MHDLDPEERLAKHRAVAAWLEYQLQQTRQTIAELEKQAANWERMKEASYRERRFTIEPSRTEDALDCIHRGNCRKQPPPVDFYLPEELLAEVGQRRMDACSLCNPLPGLRGRKTWMSDDWA